MGIKHKGKKCQRCGTDDYRILTDHHIITRSMGGTSHPDNIEILCQNCQFLTHLEKYTKKVGAPIVIKHSVDKLTESALGDKYWAHPLHWYKLELVDAEGGWWVGVCGCSNRVFTLIAPDPLMNITTLIASDVIISKKNGCEYKSKCLVTKCKYNKTTSKSYAKHKHLSEKELEWWKENWNRITNLRPVRAMCRSLGLRPYR